jgi:hypothetical protein
MPAAAALSCLRVIAGVAQGGVPAAADVERAPCAVERPEAALRYDAGAGSVRALRDLTPGDIVAAVPESLIPEIRPGQALAIETKVGSVVVTRQVEAVQAGRRGGKLFVRAADGRVFAVPVPEQAR